MSNVVGDAPQLLARDLERVLAKVRDRCVDCGHSQLLGEYTVASPEREAQPTARLSGPAVDGVRDDADSVVARRQELPAGPRPVRPNV